MFSPYSDFLLHDMGSLGDGIAQNEAGPTEFRTPPLWGLRFQPSLLHDGRATSAESADHPARRPGAGRPQPVRLAPPPAEGSVDLLPGLALNAAAPAAVTSRPGYRARETPPAGGMPAAGTKKLTRVNGTLTRPRHPFREKFGSRKGRDLLNEGAEIPVQANPEPGDERNPLHMPDDGSPFGLIGMLGLVVAAERFVASHPLEFTGNPVLSGAGGRPGGRRGAGGRAVGAVGGALLRR